MVRSFLSVTINLLKIVGLVVLPPIAIWRLFAKAKLPLVAVKPLELLVKLPNRFT